MLMVVVVMVMVMVMAMLLLSATPIISRPALFTVLSAPFVLGRSHRITSEKFITQCVSSIPNPGLMAQPD
jgi:hypothetical protein